MFDRSEKLDEKWAEAGFGWSYTSRGFRMSYNMHDNVYVYWDDSPYEFKDKTAEDIRREYYDEIGKEFAVYDSMETMAKLQEAIANRLYQE